MKWLAAILCAVAVAYATPVEKRANLPKGIDVSNYQPNVNWGSVKAAGVQFVYIKATEGTDYTSPSFNSQYTGATKAGLIRGAYHFARPDKSSGSAQASYFLKHGGGWSSDGITLPGAVDLENYSGLKACYGISQSAMVSWIADFSNTYHASTGRYPVFYTTTSWWQSCTGNNASFGKNNPLWIARWASSIGAIPAGWQYASFWQYADSGPQPGDQDYFNGSEASLKTMAKGF